MICGVVRFRQLFAFCPVRSDISDLLLDLPGRGGIFNPTRDGATTDVARRFVAERRPGATCGRNRSLSRNSG
eukprot:5244713-Prymnesium_polylepis.1